MSPRITRLATDWKAYLAILTGISATITASGDAFKQLTASIQGLPALPEQAKYVAAGILAVFALGAAIAAWSRRSILLRPDRFIVSARDPAQLIGRRREIGELAELCAAKPLVFLSGESGTGKSALARAGLVPLLRQQAREGELLPIVLDASSLSWQDGLRIELSRELSRAFGRLSAEERAQIKLADDFSPDDLFAKLGTLPPQAPRRLLLILDQLDDYLIAHRTHLSSGNTVLTPEQLGEANPDWAALAALVGDGRLRLLLICRNDIFSRLDTFRFAEVTSYSLERIEPNKISPLLDQVTQDDGKGSVIEHPEYGWAQLKPRLLRDLSGNTEQILPIQLVIALDSLSNFRPPFLTIGRYAKAGGARGLERLHIQRHLKELAASRGLSESALLQGLMLLVTERGQKTQRATREAFSQAILGRAAVGSELDPVIEHLERRHILRRQLSDDGEYLLLHHDYLARGIWEANGQANRWVEMLRQRSREFNDALTSWQRWKALLPPLAFVQLLWQRVRGRFRFGEHSAFASWSLLRFMPLLPLVAALWLGWRWVDITEQEKFAAGAFSSMRMPPPDGVIYKDEARAWVGLANANEDARFRAAQRGLSIPTHAEILSASGDVFPIAIVGLDPTGRLRRRFASEVVLPALRNGEAVSPSLICATSVGLSLGRDDALKIATALVRAVDSAKDPHVTEQLCLALQKLCANQKLEPKDLRPAATVLIEQLRVRMASLEKANVPPDSETDIQMHLIARAEAAQDAGETLSDLSALSADLESKDLQPAVIALLWMIKHADGENVSYFRTAVGPHGLKLEDKDIHAAAAELLTRMQEEDFRNAYLWGGVLAEFSPQLGPEDTSLASVCLLSSLVKTKLMSEEELVTFSRITEKLNPDHAWQLAEPLIRLMEAEETEAEAEAFSAYCEALAILGKRLDAPKLATLVALLEKRMTTATESGSSDALSSLGKTLALLPGWIEAGDVKSAATALVTRMDTEKDGPALLRLGETLAGFKRKLTVGVLQSAATKLIDQINSKLSYADLVKFGDTLAALTDLVPEDARRAATKLQETMRRGNPDPSQFASLAKAVGRLSSKLRAEDIQPVATLLLERIKIDPSDEFLDALSSLRTHLQPAQAQFALEALTARWGKYRGNEKGGVAWVELEAVADQGLEPSKRMQKYVDLLAQPLATDEVRKALINGLEALAKEAGDANAKFDGNVWKFVTWATTSEVGKTMKLQLDKRPH